MRVDRDRDQNPDRSPLKIYLESSIDGKTGGPISLYGFIDCVKDIFEPEKYLCGRNDGIGDCAVKKSIRRHGDSVRGIPHKFNIIPFSNRMERKLDGPFC